MRSFTSCAVRSVCTFASPSGCAALAGADLGPAKGGLTGDAAVAAPVDDDAVVGVVEALDAPWAEQDLGVLPGADDREHDATVRRRWSVGKVQFYAG